MHILPLSIALLTTPLLGQRSLARYDFQGDPLTPGPTVHSAGDVWNTLHHGQTDTDGLAPYGDDLVVALGVGIAFHVDGSTGDVRDTFQLAEVYDNWLAFDEARGVLLAANAATETIRGYAPGNPFPLFIIPTPSPGPVGLTWDSRRDEYAYCDWMSDEIVVVDGTSHLVVRTFDMPLTRMAGMAYDCFADEYVVGERDTRAHYRIDPATGAVLASFPTGGTGTSIPRGAAYSGDGGLWTGDWHTDLLLQLDAGHGPIAGACSSIGSPYCTSLANSTGLPAGITAVGSTSVTTDAIQLRATPVPDQPGLFYFGPAPLSVPFGDGIRCVAGPFVRLAPAPASGGMASQSLDLAQHGIVSGQDLHLQYWFRDPGTGASGFNLSNGLRITLQP